MGITRRIRQQAEKREAQRKLDAATRALDKAVTDAIAAAEHVAKRGQK